jgi:hypothetical protein
VLNVWEDNREPPPLPKTESIQLLMAACLSAYEGTASRLPMSHHHYGERSSQRESRRLSERGAPSVTEVGAGLLLTALGGEHLQVPTHHARTHTHDILLLRCVDDLWQQVDRCIE